MVFELLKRGTVGISVGGMVTFLFLTILKVQNIETSVSEIWLNMLGSLLIGVYFGIASLIFDQEGWSPLKQVVIHFTLSLAVFYPIAISLGWISTMPQAIALNLGIFVLIYAALWFGIKWYLKKLEASMNNSIK